MTDSDVKRGFFKVVPPGGMMYVDTRYFPIVIWEWHGEITPQTYDLLWQVRDEHMVDRSPKVVYVHLIDDVKAPTATTRKYLADKSKSDSRLQAPNIEFPLVMVVSNPLLRGVLTAVNWMTGKDTMPMDYQSDMARGIRAAKKILEMAAVPFPALNEDSYVLPEFAKMNASEFIQVYTSP